MNYKTTHTINLKDWEQSKFVLGGINWDFFPKISVPTHNIYPFDCRKYHWYPATFIPEIPFTLIEVLSTPNAIIYDPFGGIGTTYFQALLLNRKPITTEINTVAIHYMRALFSLFNPSIDYYSLRSQIKEICLEYDSVADYQSGVPCDVLLDKLKPWYASSTLNQLAFLFQKRASVTDENIKSALFIGISAIMKITCSQDRGWGCIADNMLPKLTQIKEKDVISLFLKHINNLLSDISEHIARTSNDYERNYDYIKKHETIFHKAITEFTNDYDDTVDLLITSPPYPNMTDYVTSQRLSYYTYGIDVNLKSDVPKSDSLKEIGARSRRHKPDSIENYYLEMQQVNRVLSQKVKKQGLACFIMPRFEGDNNNNVARSSIIERVISDFIAQGFKQIKSMERILPDRRRSHNQKWTYLERESIYIFRKE